MPFKSEAQRRLFHAKEDRGEMSHKTVEEWEHATKNKKKLPYHKKKEASIPMLLLGGAAANAGHEHANKAMIHATKKLQKANSQEKRAMDETIERAFLDELQQIGVEKLAEETEKERAHKWGKRGALAGLAYTGAAGLANHKHLAELAKHHGPGPILAGAALGAGANAAMGYGAGRLVHRIAHGKATDKKVKEAADETEKERAHKWGKRGALIGVAPNVAGLGILGGLAANKNSRPHATASMRAAGGGSLKGFAGKAALGLGVNAAMGYGAGRLTHRAVHGPASDKKVKEATGLVGSLGMDTVKQLGRNAMAGASKLVRAHPLKSVAGAAAVGRYVMPKQKESAAMAGAAKKLKKLSMGADCY